MSEGGGREPRSIAWRKRDWQAPLASFLYTFYVLVMDGLLVVSVILIAHAVEYLLDLIESGKAPVIYGYAVHASTIVRFGDYSVIIGFVFIQGVKIVIRVWNDDE